MTSSDKTIVVVDYGAGNLRNVCKALEHVGARPRLSDQASVIAAASKVILPGVGAFGHCQAGLKSRGLFQLMRDVAQSGTPFLGICVGMQLLFDVGEELGEKEGLGLVPGRVIKFRWADEKSQVPSPESRAGAAVGLAGLGTRDSGLLLRPLPVPHIGWNQVCAQQNHPLLRDVKQGGYAYFVHSFHADGVAPEHVLASTGYGYDFPSVVARDNVWGIQFHPEKSQEVGLRMLQNFAEL